MISSELQDSNRLAVKSVSYVLGDTPTLELQLTTESNVAGGPGEFPCNVVFNSSYVQQGIVVPNPSFIRSCRWASSTRIVVVGSGDMVATMGSTAGKVSEWVVSLKSSSRLAALNPQAALSTGATTLSVQNPSASGFASRQPTVSLIASLQSNPPALRIYPAIVSTSRAAMSSWVSGQLNVQVKAISSPSASLTEDIYQACANLSTLLSVQATNLLNRSPSRQMYIRLDDTSLQTAVGKIAASTTLINVTIAVTLCDETQFCGQGHSSFAANASAFSLSSPTSNTRLLVSLYPYPLWNESCATRVKILGQVRFDDANVSVAVGGNWRFTWMVRDKSSNVYSAVATASSDPSIFRFAGGYLSVNESYLLKLQVLHIATGQTAESLPTLVQCTASPLVLNVLPSQRILAIGVQDFLRINASTSYDPDSQGPVTPAAYGFTWKCRSFALATLGASNQLSYLSEGTLQRLVLRQCMVNLTDAITGRSVNITSSRSSAVVVAARSAKSLNTTNEIVVSFWDRTQPNRPMATHTFEVQVLSGVHQIVRVMTAHSSRQRVDPNRGLFLNVNMVNAASTSRSIAASWQWLGENGRIGNPTLRSMTITNTTSSVVIFSPSSGTASVPLSLRAGTLVSSGYYRFRLNCDGMNTDVDVKTNAAPFGGSLLTYPSQGWALETLFSLQAPWWRDSDGDYPLTYAIAFQEPFYRSSRSVLTTTSASWTKLPHYDRQWFVENVHLPTGMMNDSYRLLLQVTVTDTLMSSTALSSNTTVVLPYRLPSMTETTQRRLTATEAVSTQDISPPSSARIVQCLLSVVANASSL
eukprot:gene18266-13126_t